MEGRRPTVELLANTLPRFSIPDARTRAECQARYEEAREAEARELLKRRIEDAAIPARFSRADISECCEEVRRWVAEADAEGADKWLVLIGRNGRGKTYEACAALKALARSRRVLFASAARVVEEAAKGREAAALYANVPALLIDDLGKEDAAAWKCPAAFEVLDARHASARLTIVTTNLGSDGLLKHYCGRAGDVEGVGSGIVSRLSSARIVRFDGPDKRLRMGGAR